MADTYLNQAELDDLTKALTEASAQDAVEIIDIDWKELQIKAQNFLRSFENLQRAQQHAQLTNLKQIINDPKSSNYIMMRGTIEAYYQKAKYLLAFEFDRYLNVFLGGLPKEAIYVFEDRKTGEISTYKMTMSELAMHSKADGRLDIALSRLKRTTGSKKELQQEERKSIEESGTVEKEHMLKAQCAYKAVTARLNRYFEKKKDNIADPEEKKKVQRQAGILMWKLSGKWTLARVLNFGDIKEAYTAALLTKHNTPEDKLARVPAGNPKYYGHALVATFFHYYLHKVDSQAAILGEDVETEDTQYGVKSKRAPLPSLNQYVNTARWITQQGGGFSAEDLHSHLKTEFNNSSMRNNVITTLEHITEKNVQKFLSDEEAAIVSSLSRGWGR